MSRLFLLLSCGWWWSCLPCSTQAPVNGPDGGVARCVQTQDCPRPSSLLTCTNAEDRLKGCIECLDGACVEFTPEQCR